MTQKRGVAFLMFVFQTSPAQPIGSEHGGGGVGRGPREDRGGDSVLKAKLPRQEDKFSSLLGWPG